VTIQDDEPVISVAATTPTTNETPGTAAAVFTFTRTGPTTSALTIPYTIGGAATAGTDYTTLSGMVTFRDRLLHRNGLRLQPLMTTSLSPLRPSRVAVVANRQLRCARRSRQRGGDH